MGRNGTMNPANITWVWAKREEVSYVAIYRRRKRFY